MDELFWGEVFGLSRMHGHNAAACKCGGVLSFTVAAASERFKLKLGMRVPINKEHLLLLLFQLKCTYRICIGSTVNPGSC